MLKCENCVFFIFEKEIDRYSEEGTEYKNYCMLGEWSYNPPDNMQNCENFVEEV